LFNVRFFVHSLDWLLIDHLLNWNWLLIDNWLLLNYLRLNILNWFFVDFLINLWSYVFFISTVIPSLVPNGSITVVSVVVIFQFGEGCALRVANECHFVIDVDIVCLLISIFCSAPV
jgi:hypothetical protein